MSLCSGQRRWGVCTVRLHNDSDPFRSKLHQNVADAGPRSTPNAAKSSPRLAHAGLRLIESRPPTSARIPSIPVQFGPTLPFRHQHSAIGPTTAARGLLCRGATHRHGAQVCGESLGGQLCEFVDVVNGAAKRALRGLVESGPVLTTPLLTTLLTPSGLRKTDDLGPDQLGGRPRASETSMFGFPASTCAILAYVRQGAACSERR